MTEPYPARFPGVTFAAIAAELAREVMARRETYPRMIASGNLTQPEAQHQISVMEAIAADCARFQQAIAQCVNSLTLPAPHKYPWGVRRAALQRELDLRRRMYPQWIAKGRLTAPAARQQVQRMDAMLALYEDGRDWIPANGTPPAFGQLNPSPAQQQSREEWSAIAADIMARLYPQQQEALAL